MSKTTKENKMGTYFGWAIIVGFLAWALWVGKAAYDVYSVQYEVGVRAANAFWDQHNTERGQLLAGSIQEFKARSKPRAKKVPFTSDTKGFRTVVLELQPLREWAKENGWDSGFHAVLDMKPK